MRKFVVVAVIAVGAACLLWFGGSTIVGWLKAFHGQ